MKKSHDEQNELQVIEELAKRAEFLIDRRKVILGASKALALPALVSLSISREAMGQSGSGGSSQFSLRRPKAK